MLTLHSYTLIFTAVTQNHGDSQKKKKKKTEIMVKATVIVNT